MQSESNFSNFGIANVSYKIGNDKIARKSSAFPDPLPAPNSPDTIAMGVSDARTIELSTARTVEHSSIREYNSRKYQLFIRKVWSKGQSL